MADQAAKDPTNDDDPSSLPVPYTDQRRHINSFVRSKWQNLWDVAVNNKLHAIQPSVGRWPGSRHCMTLLVFVTGYLNMLWDDKDYFIFGS